MHSGRPLEEVVSRSRAGVILGDSQFLCLASYQPAWVPVLQQLPGPQLSSRTPVNQLLLA